MNQNIQVPLYVKTYDQLYQMIKADHFNEKLPGEETLAKSLAVSRTTLRQALSLLQDDGLIKNVKGVGNFLVSNEQKKETLNRLENPMNQVFLGELTTQEIFYKLDFSSQYTNEIFERQLAAVVSCERWFGEAEKKQAFIFTFLPIDTIDRFKIDLQDQGAVQQFLNDAIYQAATRSEVEIKLSNSANIASQRYQVSGGDQCILLIERLYQDKELIAHNKFYLPKQFAHITFMRAQ